MESTTPKEKSKDGANAKTERNTRGEAIAAAAARHVTTSRLKRQPSKNSMHPVNEDSRPSSSFTSLA
jgi:hypothetical protein